MAAQFRFLLLLICFGINIARADAQVFPLRSSNTQEVLDTLRAALGERAKVDIIQQKIVVVGDTKTLSEAAVLLRQIDKLPANLHLTLTENLPTESLDATSNTVVYTAEKNSQMLDTLEGALVSADYTKFHQAVETNGWMFSVNDQPVAVKQLQMRLKMLDKLNVQVTMSFTRYENQERKVYGRVVMGKLGTWIPLLPELANTTANTSTSNAATYSSGTKPGEQLYLKVERVVVPRKLYRESSATKVVP